MENFGKLYGTQKGIILGHLLLYGSITEREAFLKYFIPCTAQCIYDLRKMGFGIYTKKVFFRTRHGGVSYYARYQMKTPGEAAA